MGRKASAVRYREREAIDREYRVRAADLERGIRTLVESHLPTRTVAANWRLYVKAITARTATWPARLAPAIASAVTAGMEAHAAAMQTEEAVRSLLGALAEEGPSLPIPPADRRALAELRGFTAPLPVKASAREKMITLRSRRSALRAAIKRGEYEPIAGIRRRQTDAVMWARQALLLGIPRAAITAIQGRTADLEKLTRLLAEAVEDGLRELRRVAADRDRA